MNARHDPGRIRLRSRDFLDLAVALLLAAWIAVAGEELLTSLLRETGVIAGPAISGAAKEIPGLVALALVASALLLSRQFASLPQWPTLSGAWLAGGNDPKASPTENITAGDRDWASRIIPIFVLAALVADVEIALVPGVIYGAYRLAVHFRRVRRQRSLAAIDARIAGTAGVAAPIGQDAPSNSGYQTARRFLRRHLAALPGFIVIQPLRLVISIIDGVSEWLSPALPLIAYVLGVAWRALLLCALVTLLATAALTLSRDSAVAVTTTTDSPWQAISTADAATLRELLGKGASPDTTDWQGRTLLMAALETLADATSREAYDELAARRAVVDVLLDHRPDISTLDHAGRSASMLALSAGYVPDRLAPTNPTEMTRLGTTLLHAAAGSGDIDLARRMVALGVPVHTVSNDGRTALHFARGAEMTRYLLRQGLAPDRSDARGRTPFHYAVMRGDLDAAWLVGGLTTDRSHRDIFGKTAFDYAPDMQRDNVRTKDREHRNKRPDAAQQQSQWSRLRDALSPQLQDRSGEWK